MNADTATSSSTASATSGDSSSGGRFSSVMVSSMLCVCVLLTRPYPVPAHLHPPQPPRKSDDRWARGQLSAKWTAFARNGWTLCSGTNTFLACHVCERSGGERSAYGRCPIGDGAELASARGLGERDA